MNWSPGIGDPTWTGWLTTFAYFLAAWFSFDSFRRSRLRVWLAIGLVMLLLGLNKQLDLQTLIADVGRGMAQSEGWFAYWRPVQRVFAVITVGLFAVSAPILYNMARRQQPAVRLSILGAILIFAYVVMRAVTFEHVHMLDLGDNFNAVMELGGIVCVGCGAWRGRYGRL